MEKLMVSWLLSVLFITTSFAQYGTERTGYEGDYFSLEGALDLFKESNSLRDFERKLNTEENWVNNLDLNYDGRIDYIRVEHRRQGDYHAIILQAVVDRYDVQDVAVIEMEVIGRRDAILQIVGDEDLYGEEVIVEPVEGYSDSRRGYHSEYGDYVNVYYWRPVQYILGRQYRVYASPYRWQYYPAWWSPWVQCTWNVFRPRIVIYHRHYHVVRRHRVIRVHNFYRPYRSYSYNVVVRTNKVRVRHGRAPIHRPAPAVQRDQTPGNYTGRNNGAARPDIRTRSNTPGQNPPISRKRTESAFDREVTQSRSPRIEQRSPNTNDATGRPRSINRSDTPGQSPSVSRKRTESAFDREATRSRTPRTEQRSPNTNDATGRPRSIDRSGTPGQSPSASRKRTESGSNRSEPRSRMPQRTQPSHNNTTPSSRTPSTSNGRGASAQPDTRKSTPSGTYRSSRNQTTRSSTPTRSRPATRSATPTRKPSAGSRKAAPASKPGAARSKNQERSSSKAPSRSRKRGGE